MEVVTKEVRFTTKGPDDIIDITSQIRKELGKTKQTNGIVTVFVHGSTGAVTTTESEPGLKKDLPEFYEKIVPRNKSYYHDQTWGDANGFSHLRAALQGPTLTVPFDQGKLLLGTWQQIVLAEFDNRSRSRRIVVQIIGE